MLKKNLFFRGLALLLVSASVANAADLECIWLSHQGTEPGKMVVNFESDQPGNAIVEFGRTPELGQRIAQDGNSTLHHVEIPVPRDASTLYYRVRSGKAASRVHSFKGYPRQDLRVVVVGNIGYSKAAWGDAVLKESPHLLLTTGDQVPALHDGKPVPPGSTAAFSRLVERWPALFASTPWMPLLGNHDREIRPRGDAPPADPVYDVEAKAFRDFFALPGIEWRWRFDMPEFGARFVALDLSHVSDFGTTWQTGHSFARKDAQFASYNLLLEASRSTPFLITLYNERNSTVRALEAGDWGKMLAQNSLCISGFGYFGERAEFRGASFYNTSANGTGDRYPDPNTSVLKAEDNYLLLTFRKEPARLRVELKNLDGAVLDSRDFTSRER